MSDDTSPYSNEAPDGYQPEAIPVIVAAELRRLADKITGELAELITNVCADEDFDGGVLDVVRELRSRADELSPPA